MARTYLEEEATVFQIATWALKSRLFALVFIVHILHSPLPQNRLDEALMKEDLSSTFLKVTATDRTIQLSKC